MSTGLYVLEVVRFITEKDGPDGWINKGGKQEHIGYMKVKFRTKKDACSFFYDKYINKIKNIFIKSNIKFNYFEFKSKRFYKTQDIIFVFDN